ncbi:fibrinogen-like protein 1 [Drosophila takahashii]|uniref:fibrinogen-like protein 1 n=1 Tax=Drosophila takahashii TaxID=29030 RepID=UPI001CF88F39|nr:fibrinogen-like protein 1 [Drosophila takahashii]
MNETIQNLESRLPKETDQLRIINGANGCPYFGLGGIYKAKLKGLEDFEVPCPKSGWMTIQKRYDGSENFDRSWEDYRNGFGKVTREFFLGLEKIHLMTKSQPHELFIELTMVNGSTSHALYDYFEIGNETESYVLKSLGKYSGTAGDSLVHHLNQKFTTFDRDNDKATYNCAGGEFGGWWYNNCAESTLNGKYYRSGIVQTTHRNGIYWTSFTSWTYIKFLTSAEMMIRPRLD